MKLTPKILSMVCDEASNVFNQTLELEDVDHETILQSEDFKSIKKVLSKEMDEESISDINLLKLIIKKYSKKLRST